MRLHRSFSVGALLVAVVLAGSAVAQSRYVCRSANGQATLSDRPCASDRPGITYHGPLSPSTQRSTLASQVAAPADHLQFLGAQCSAMLEGIRTGPARGVNGQTTAELQRNYQQQCKDDDREARAKLAESLRDHASAQAQTKQQAHNQLQRTALAQQQCDESKRIIHGKRKRTDLSEGEKDELARFESNYKSRCA